MTKPSKQCKTVLQFDHHVSSLLGGNEQRRMMVMSLHDIDI
jgi:hypothetical protein